MSISFVKMNGEPDDKSGNSAATEKKSSVAPPPLPRILLDPRPVLAACTFAWIVAGVAAFAFPALHSWRPVTVAGLGLAVFGTCLFLWQRQAARRGSRGAQSGLS